MSRTREENAADLAYEEAERATKPTQTCHGCGGDFPDAYMTALAEGGANCDNCVREYLEEAAPDLLHACKLALQLIKDTWVEDHGSRQVGEAWGVLEEAIKLAEGSA